MRLLEPLALGPRTARNRLLFGPHETNLARDRSISDRHAAYYARRARGGCGVIVVEEASVHPSDWPYERAPAADQSADGYRLVARAVHEHGALAVAALGHAGSQGSSAYHQRALWAPSPFPDPSTREVPQAMEPDEIDEVVDGFGRAAAVAVGAGLDGVEVNAGQHSLVRQFLSGLTNLRDDDDGHDRLRFARRVLDAVRAAAGAGVTVGLRLSCDELAPWAGITPESGAAIAADLAPLVDYIVVVRGSIYSAWATRPDGHEGVGFNLEAASLVRAALPPGAAVYAQGSIVDAELAEATVAAGRADGCEMTRAQIAEPDLAVKLARGDAGRVRPCILCNQRCMVRDVRNPIVSCVAEPSAGHEGEDPDWEAPAARPRQLTVAGGGPAGLECARVAATRGHRVRLVEATDSCGGMVRVAARLPGHERLARLVEWLEAECLRLGVEIVTGASVPVEQADVVATGSVPGAAELDASEDGRVVDPVALLADGADAVPEGPVVVWDPVGGPVGVGVAELLAIRGPVTLVSPDFLVGRELTRTGDLVPANLRLRRAGVTLTVRSRVSRVQAGTAEVEDLYAGTTEPVPAVAVVDAGHRLPDDQAAGAAAIRAGDCVAPRTLYEAVLEGRRAALAAEERGS
jgi:2,4-dienoyl-CoA reductase (NADPH2)